ncbi:MAG: Ig-like domain repeat protein, partial [Cytophagales bacterium]|nr:Ig-like domain repeat protein [Cytophagales bacterium]
QLRRNNKIKIYNTFITGYPTGLYIDSQRGAAKANALAGDLVTKNVVIAGTASHGTTGFSTTGTNSNIYGLGVAISDLEQLPKTSTNAPILIGTETPTVWFKAIAGNDVLATTANTGISTSLWPVSGRPTFTLTAGKSESLIGTNLPTLTGTTATDYVGAFKDTDWTATWAEFAPNTVLYLK